MTVPKKEESVQEAKQMPVSCLGCRKGEKSVEASRARFEHLLSIGRSRGEKGLKQHIVEQFGEEGFQMSYAGAFSHICRILLVDGWKMDLKMENLKSREGL